MLKNLIVIKEDKENQYNTIDELIVDLLGESYYSLNQQKQEELIRNNILLNYEIEKINSRERKEVQLEEIENKLKKNKEITYILSLLKIGNIVLLEEKDANIFLKEEEKSQFRGNYIIVNNFAEKLLNNI